MDTPSIAAGTLVIDALRAVSVAEFVSEPAGPVTVPTPGTVTDTDPPEPTLAEKVGPVSFTAEGAISDAAEFDRPTWEQAVNATLRTTMPTTQRRISWL